MGSIRKPMRCWCHPCWSCASLTLFLFYNHRPGGSGHPVAPVIGRFKRKVDGILFLFQSYSLIQRKRYCEVQCLSQLCIFCSLSFGKNQHACTNIRTYVVRYTGYSHLLPFLGQHSCRTYRGGNLPLLCGTLCITISSEPCVYNMLCLMLIFWFPPSFWWKDSASIFLDDVR